MSQRNYQDNPSQNNYQGQQSQAYKIAQKMSTIDYFLDTQSQLLDQWSNKSLELFKFTGDVFINQYEIKCSKITNQYGSNYHQQYSKCKKQFQAYCILSRKVQKKNDQIQNLAQHFNKKNHKKNFFNAWRGYANHKLYLRNKQQESIKYHLKYRLKSILKSWLGITMNNNRTKIKNQVLHKTQIQISKIQTEYQKLIKGLEQTLEKRLSQLKKQQEQHKLLHNKYQTMYSRSKVQNAPR